MEGRSAVIMAVDSSALLGKLISSPSSRPVRLSARFPASRVDISLSRLATFPAAPIILHDAVSTQFGPLLLFAKVEL